jgi:hypothetical protein
VSGAKASPPVFRPTPQIAAAAALRRVRYCAANLRPYISQKRKGGGAASSGGEPVVGSARISALPHAPTSKKGRHKNCPPFLLRRAGLRAPHPACSAASPLTESVPTYSRSSVCPFGAALSSKQTGHPVATPAGSPGSNANPIPPNPPCPRQGKGGGTFSTVSPHFLHSG